jgi:DNA-binding NtrC family response regulator
MPLLMKTNSPFMLIEGEPGTGKSLCAQLVESLCPKSMPFFRVNCSEYNNSQIEMELFGHKRGAIAGARTDKEGLLEKANGGVVVLEEISNLPHSAQASIVNLLETRDTRRIGEVHRRPTSVKLVCTSSVPLETLCERKTLIPELYDYLKCFRVSIPPLRARPVEERIELIRYFVSKLENGKYSVDQPALELLLKYDWAKGNLRELLTVLRSMTMLQYGNRITALSIPEDILNQVKRVVSEPMTSMNSDETRGPKVVHNITIPVRTDKKLSFEEYSDVLFLELVKLCDKTLMERHSLTSFSKLAQSLELSRPTIMRKIAKLMKSKLITKKEVSSWKG